MRKQAWKRCVCMMVCLCLILASMSGCRKAAPSAPEQEANAQETTPAPTPKPTPKPTPMPEPTPSLPKSGYAVDENGVCITTSEFFDCLLTLLTDSDSPFYPGVDVIMWNGETHKEIRSVAIQGVDTGYTLNPTTADGESFAQDNEPFYQLIVMGDTSTEMFLMGMMEVCCAVVYLTNPDADGFQNAKDFMVNLLDNAGNWVKAGVMEFQFSRVSGDICALYVREASA